MVILPDDIIEIVGDSPGAIAQMLEVCNRHGGGVVAVEPMPWDVVQNYGVVEGSPVEERLQRVTRLVEKPPRQEARSNLAIVGGYVLPPEIFDCLDRTPAGAKDEIQLTDALVLLLESHDLYAYEFKGARYDGGSPMGLLRASIEFALARPDTRAAAKALLAGLGGVD